LGLRHKIYRKPEVSSLIDSILAMIVCMPAWRSFWTRARFTVLVSCSDELAVHPCPLLCLWKQVAKRASGLLYCWSLLRSSNMATNLQTFTSSYSSRSGVTRGLNQLAVQNLAEGGPLASVVGRLTNTQKKS